MKEYVVIYEGTIRETYLVTANSEDEAREIWSDFDAMSSEMIDGEVVDVVEDDE
ncbi:hypothetical protein SEA_WATERT_115 [Microbacterium phage WaterT]|nr:hypothetical protein SEA_WATERT_115 [Microbacterium phage WaterT]